MAVKLLTDAGVAVCSSRLLLLCDNPFREHIERGLDGRRGGAWSRASGCATGRSTSAGTP